jgi:hypothetical protein
MAISKCIVLNNCKFSHNSEQRTSSLRFEISVNDKQGYEYSNQIKSMKKENLPFHYCFIVAVVTDHQTKV